MVHELAIRQNHCDMLFLFVLSVRVQDVIFGRPRSRILLHEAFATFMSQSLMSSQREPLLIIMFSRLPDPPNSLPPPLPERCTALPFWGSSTKQWQGVQYIP